ncbi:hypothetical protein BDA99DRAFT_520507 [Phascolomyces articulosus]|uniref:Uncharacterized protein n=1 Tax=Phascolomyces articulosus TaxID=60185 RepID=A0AAD5K312_9FUNG|nr:hypothetical protein BDA99DRAFT_520507 [Phascolomyces articulosus]
MPKPNPVSPPDVKKASQNQKRRTRKRHRHKKKRQEVDVVFNQPKNLDLNDLISEASALERQLGELQTQLKANHANMPSKEQGRRANAIATEQIIATEDEIQYVRKSLKMIYRQILTDDITYAATHHIEDKLWRYICYANIEQVRSKLRKIRPDEDNVIRQRLQRQLLKRIDSSFKFYRELNNSIKDNHHLDTKTIGIDLFRQGVPTGDEQVAVILQSNYICMGDIARYRASTSLTNKKANNENWRLAKECYQKAIDCYRSSGKPYSQLALVSLSSGSAVDVVWYYCMSLAMKQPSTVGRDNLKSFYSKIRFSSPENSTNANESCTKMISQFIESFLQTHKQAMFGDPNNIVSMPNILETVITKTVSSVVNEDGITKIDSSTIHVLKGMLSRTIVILLITIWDIGERMKIKGNLPQWTQLQSSQIRLLSLGFKLFAGLVKATHDGWTEAKEKISQDAKYEQLNSMVENAILSALSIWCTYLANNLPVIAQYCTSGAGADGRRDNERKELVKAVQSFVSALINHPMFPDPVVNVLPVTYPVSEDVLLLGVVPLTRFHATVDFFKENAYDAIDESKIDARKQIRWGRVRELVKKIADSTAFDFVQYNKNEQKYSVVDENAKRQQQSRFMKALATQRLMDQVSSLEKNVSRMNLSSTPPNKVEVYTVVVDVTAFLDGLNKIKKWANQTLNPNNRSQDSILEVLVPLETIDSLDVHKKGSSHMNMQARESIRYLDQHLAREKPKDTTTSYLRTQKVNEQLSEWSQAEAYWIGEESRANIVDALLSDEDDEDDNGDKVIHESDVESLSSSDDLFESRRRQFDEEDEDDSSEPESSSSEEESEDEEEQDTTTQFNQVPRAYIPIISCMLYNLKERLVLVTNDENLAWWVEMFGDPETGRRLCVKTVDEWDQIVRTMSFNKSYTYSWKRR